MPYTDVDKIRSMFRRISIKPDTGNEKTNTVVTEEDITLWIDEEEALINAFLSDYYEVPITGTEALKVMSRIATYKVAHVVKTVLEAKDGLSDKDQIVQSNLDKKADMLLDQVIPHWDQKCCEWIDPRIQLIDAVRKSVGPKTGSTFSSNRREGIIKKGGDNW